MGLPVGLLEELISSKVVVVPVLGARHTHGVRIAIGFRSGEGGVTVTLCQTHHSQSCDCEGLSIHLYKSIEPEVVSKKGIPNDPNNQWIQG